MPSEELTRIQVRFYGCLNDFIPRQRRRRFFGYSVKGHPAVKDAVEALGVPHPEVGYILLHKQPVDFSCQVNSNDRLEIYPNTIRLKIGKGVPFLAPSLVRKKFVLDSHLGKLARHLRLLGYDTHYQNVFPDTEIIRLSNSSRRIILTRDIGLLKNGAVRWGCWIRSTDSLKQLDQVIARYGPFPRRRIFTRCLECNGRIRRVKKAGIRDQLPPQVRRYYRAFYRCRVCRKIYWRGSHYGQLQKVVARARWVRPCLLLTMNRNPLF